MIAPEKTKQVKLPPDKEIFIISETTTHFVIRLRNGGYGIGVYKVTKEFIKKMIREKGWEVLNIESSK